MIPIGTNYPNELDTNTNMYEVNDSIRMVLAEDYIPGNTSIKVEVDYVVGFRIPPTGLITLTEQCSDIDERAISFFYSEWDSETNTFNGVEILPYFKNVIKPKRITNVVANVMALHHNNIKEALIAIQKFCGVKGTEDTEPFGETLEGRINFLRRLVMQPKAWFTCNKRTGNAPLEIEFRDMSFRLGTDGNMDEVKVTYDFGDNTISTISTINASNIVPDISNVSVVDVDGGTIKKTYHHPGIYTVKLTVENKFGKDICEFEDYINVRMKAPNEAIFNYVPDSSLQIASAGVPPSGPYLQPPTIRTPINTLINIEIPIGENPATPGYSYAGEILNGNGEAIDPIVSYNWMLSDDMFHPNASETQASFSIGGVYDMKLRVDTKYGSYRISNFEDTIDVVENVNLWLWTINSANLATSYEYGLISETFKIASSTTLHIDRNDSFLNTLPTASISKAKQEFKRNVGFSPRSNTPSGLGGSALIYYSTGRNQSDPITSEKINVTEFDGFSQIYISRPSITRPWNWAHLQGGNKSYFVFGSSGMSLPNSSPTNTSKLTQNVEDLSTSNSTFNTSNYLNGAQELEENVASYDINGNNLYGDFSVYRTTWKDNTGFIARNDGVGAFFRIKSFYKTEGTLANPFVNLRKIQDIQGATKLEGQLETLNNGVYFFNNSGSLSRYETEANVWRSGGPGINSLVFRRLQDTTVSQYDNLSHSLVSATDKENRAYLSYDYTSNSFLKFSSIDNTFSSLGKRPSGEQFMMNIY